MLCECCGKEVGEISFDKGFSMPDEIWNLTETEREERAKIHSDLCRLDERYFLRGVAHIPVQRTDQTYGWGIWAEVPKSDFMEYVESYSEDNSSKPKFSGMAANSIPTYECTIDLSLIVQLGNENQRPTFYFSDSSHLLSIEQEKGISVEKVHSFN